MKPSLEELQQQLDEAKRNLERVEEIGKEYNATLAGKAFMESWSQPRTKHTEGWKSCRLVRFDSFTPGYDGTFLEWKGAEVNVSVDSSRTWGFSYTAKAGSSVCQGGFTMPTIEISLDLFKAAVEYSKVSAASTMSVLRGIHDDARALDWKPGPRVPSDAEQAVEFDLKAVELVNGESTILGNTMFTTIDDRYLITPQSVALAEALIRKARESLDSCSAFMQDCDVRYYQLRHEMLKGLEEKVRKG